MGNIQFSVRSHHDITCNQCPDRIVSSQIMSRHLETEFLRNCEENNLNRVTECLSRGVDVNTVSEDGHWSGLTIAARMNYPALVDILLSHPDIEINNTTTVDIEYADEDDEHGGQPTS